ncbi:hypothetical protein P7K49_034999 [Saguinus oedipus]|uniref:Uncharacterized protein n=1 Tax=Saguinus oedipus TaxID=9490 RepID=A0ABQ9TY35_SAGOE|nr:hypothetical protein P7K49_034999 [Saguinus oedipus]
MDPNTLSMKQGKEFLKQCGIPQRDIDLMTEKWVVLASVEVLLRFPLRSGEDPTARCVSNKRCQPSVDRPSTVSQRCGHQEERKPNNQLMKKTDQKLKDLPQVAGDSIRHQAQRPSTARNPQKQQRKPVGPRAPPADEKECRVSGGLKMWETKVSAWIPEGGLEPGARGYDSGEMQELRGLWALSQEHNLPHEEVEWGPSSAAPGLTQGGEEPEASKASATPGSRALSEG